MVSKSIFRVQTPLTSTQGAVPRLTSDGRMKMRVFIFRLGHALTVVLFCSLVAWGEAFAVSFSGSVIASWSSDSDFATIDSGLVFEGGYQPRASNGLVAASAQVDLTGPYGASIVAAGAVYGTDSSRSAVSQTIPELLISGLGVEPMADIMVQATGGTTVGESGNLVSRTSATGATNMQLTVQHRVVLDPTVTIPPAILGDVVANMNNVPVQLLWRYSFERSGTTELYLGFHVSSPTGDCPFDFCGSRVVALYNFFPTATQSFEDAGVVSFTASTTTASRDALYDISLTAWATATSDVETQFVDAVYDPFLTVDPDWVYSDYFVVQQESTLNEGEWVAITRDYLGPVVPLPASVWLFSSGLLGLVGIARRKRVSKGSGSIENP